MYLIGSLKIFCICLCMLMKNLFLTMKKHHIVYIHLNYDFLVYLTVSFIYQLDWIFFYYCQDIFTPFKNFENLLSGLYFINACNKYVYTGSPVKSCCPSPFQFENNIGIVINSVSRYNEVAMHYTVKLISVANNKIKNSYCQCNMRYRKIVNNKAIKYAWFNMKRYLIQNKAKNRMCKQYIYIWYNVLSQNAGGKRKYYENNKKIPDAFFTWWRSSWTQKIMVHADNK